MRQILRRPLPHTTILERCGNRCHICRFCRSSTGQQPDAAPAADAVRALVYSHTAILKAPDEASAWSFLSSHQVLQAALVSALEGGVRNLEAGEDPRAGTAVCSTQRVW